DLRQPDFSCRRGDRLEMLFAAMHESGYGRYCCKSPKLPGANFLAVKKSDRRPPIDVAPITLPRSPASLSSGNGVPHIFTRKSRVQPKKILVTSARRLLQQNLPTADSCTAAKTSAWRLPPARKADVAFYPSCQRDVPESR